ncbi:MAG: fibrobacter succinogenes major paralogous domain-containing protein [Fibromonadaceae bacterium]|jgi:uncharacterized protein (TIGR02145 family)|nr:fibrobacter succinogenes major paralogous domain-containing protein [Fibromonadaceae bacterium]
MNKIHSNGKRFFAPAIAAGLMLAMAFTLSACGGDGGGGGDEAPSSSSSGNGSLSSSSSGGDTTSFSSQPSHEHTWGEWSVTTAATCEAAGVKTRTCAGDNSHKDTQPIAKLDWEWTATTPATPTTVGEETGTCHDNAYNAKTRPIPMKCGGYNPSEKFCDERDEKTYKYVEINGQTWMAENLNFNADGSRCYGDNTGGDSEGKCADYGRLYDWATAMGLEASCNSSDCSSQIQPNHQGVCPSGWHIPSGAEWQALVDFAGGDETAGTKLKSASGWNAGSGYIPGTDDHGFSALPGGIGNSDGSFFNAGSDGYWWSASEGSGSGAYLRYMYYSREYARWLNDGKSSLFSVRCLRD